jgi:hypothetical protein
MCLVDCELVQRASANSKSWAVVFVFVFDAMLAFSFLSRNNRHGPPPRPNGCSGIGSGINYPGRHAGGIKHTHHSILSLIQSER